MKLLEGCLITVATSHNLEVNRKFGKKINNDLEKFQKD